MEDWKFKKMISLLWTDAQFAYGFSVAPVCRVYIVLFFPTVTEAKITPVEGIELNKKSPALTGDSKYLLQMNSAYFLAPRSSEIVSLWRPFARRLANTLRPLASCIRLRKPCVVFLRRFEGWYVRFFPGIVCCFTSLKIPGRNRTFHITQWEHHFPLFVKGRQR